MSGTKNQKKKCKPLGYQQANLQRHLQLTRSFTKGIYKNEVQCKVKLQVRR
jgi:hypothetical protein